MSEYECSNCNNEVKFGDKYCAKCGRLLEWPKKAKKCSDCAEDENTSTRSTGCFEMRIKVIEQSLFPSVLWFGGSFIMLVHCIIDPSEFGHSLKDIIIGFLVISVMNIIGFYAVRNSIAKYRMARFIDRHGL